MSSPANKAAVVALQKAFRLMKEDPVEGIAVDLPDESNLFEWDCYIEGPKDTPYEGGIFKARMKFPEDYPMSPPELYFISEMWHPNVFKDGKVCISILHPPSEDPLSGELPEERWRPTQTVATILLSVQSMLNDPNFSSPANVDASVEWRNNREEFVKRVKKLIENAKITTPLPPHIKIPHPDSDPQERQKQLEKLKLLNKDITLDEFNDDDGDNDDDEDDYDMGDYLDGDDIDPEVDFEDDATSDK
jgi:ubiquitin-conjugating enzyme E2 R